MKDSTDHDAPESPVKGEVEGLSTRKFEEGIALCLSGGGYRAMLFHLGALWRLYELGILKDVKRISSVSGGSITAAALGRRWSQLSFKPAAVRKDFEALVVKDVRALARKTIDAFSINR